MRDGRHMFGNHHIVALALGVALACSVWTMADVAGGSLYPARCGKLWGYVDHNGAFVIQPKFLNAYHFSEGLAVVKAEDGWQFIDYDGNKAIEMMFSYAMRFSDGLAAVKSKKADEQWGYVDRKGKWAIPPRFEVAHPFSEGLAPIKMDGLWGYIDVNGILVIKNQYRDARIFSEGMGVVRNIDGNLTIVDRQGKVIINTQSTEMFEFHNGLAASGWTDSKDSPTSTGVGFIDHRGHYRIAPRFTGAFAFSEGLAAVRMNDMWGYIDVYGNVKIPHRYSSAGRFHGGRAMVRMTPDRMLLIDTAGSIIYDEERALADAK